MTAAYYTSRGFSHFEINGEIIESIHAAYAYMKQNYGMDGLSIERFFNSIQEIPIPEKGGESDCLTDVP